MSDDENNDGGDWRYTGTQTLNAAETSRTRGIRDGCQLMARAKEAEVLTTQVKSEALEAVGLLQWTSTAQQSPMLQGGGRRVDEEEEKVEVEE